MSDPVSPARDSTVPGSAPKTPAPVDTSRSAPIPFDSHDGDVPDTALGGSGGAGPRQAMEGEAGSQYPFTRLQASHSKLQKFMLYETKVRYYLVGTDNARTRHKILKIDRTKDQTLNITEDPTEYNAQEFRKLLSTLREGNRSIGGLTHVHNAYGIVGFIRFLEGYYMILITKRTRVGVIGGHFVFSIDDTAFIRIAPPEGKDEHSQWSSAETRYRNLFSCVDLTKDFYFSHTYDLTHTLQFNMTRSMRVATGKTVAADHHWKFQFVWNDYLMEDFSHCIDNQEWMVPVIHGFFSQKQLSFSSRTVNLTVLARRSRFFAGTRYLKRGVNDIGDVANDVETEQIVHEVSAGTRNYGHYSSLVQVRGSIPLFWKQEGGITHPKPDIILQRYDPYYSASKLHFADMFRRYGSPIIALNLVKHKEKVPRENILRKEFAAGIRFINDELPEEHRLKYVAWDLHRTAKAGKGEHVLQMLDAIAQVAIDQIGFFHSGKTSAEAANRDPKHLFGRFQEGVLRTNCIDCLDRTNFAQFCAGKVCLGRQLHVMGVLARPELSFGSEVVQLLMDMYEGMGDRMAWQYGGSSVIPSNYKESARTGPSSNQSSRAVLASIRRYYSNTFTDAEKQDAINLFLGNFVPEKGHLHIWELDSDYYLHTDEERRGDSAVGRGSNRPTTASDAATHDDASINTSTSTSPPGLAEESDDDWWDKPIADFKKCNLPPVIDPTPAAKGDMSRRMTVAHQHRAFPRTPGAVLARDHINRGDSISLMPRMVLDDLDEANGNSRTGSLDDDDASDEDGGEGDDNDQPSVFFEEYYQPGKLSSFDKILACDFNKAHPVGALNSEEPDARESHTSEAQVAAERERFRRWLKLAGQRMQKLQDDGALMPHRPSAGDDLNAFSPSATLGRKSTLSQKQAPGDLARFQNYVELHHNPSLLAQDSVETEEFYSKYLRYAGPSEETPVTDDAADPFSGMSALSDDANPLKLLVLDSSVLSGDHEWYKFYTKTDQAQAVQQGLGRRIRFESSTVE